MSVGARPRRIRCKKDAALADRLALHSVVAPSGCWIWLGARSNGYGRMTVDGRCRFAHRVSYETHVGPIPDGLQIDHLCRRPACIRPDHLQPVTPRVNFLRGTSPAARAQRRDCCTAGHAYAEHAQVRADGRRICAPCRRAKKRAYNARVAQERRAAHEAWMADLCAARRFA